MNAENKTPIASISDAEHSVPTSEKNIPEFAFFNEEAIRIKQAFSKYGPKRTSIALSTASTKIYETHYD